MPRRKLTSARFSPIARSAGAVDADFLHLKWLSFIQRGACRRGQMNHVREATFWKIEGTNIAVAKRNPLARRLRMAAQDDHLRGEPETPVRGAEAPGHPASEKAGAAGDQDGGASKLVPQSFGVLEDVFDVVCGQDTILSNRFDRNILNGMLGTMQDYPLTLTMLFRHGARIHSKSEVASYHADRVDRATCAEGARSNWRRP